ncbi:MAG: NAD-dependent protein deacetylase [Planctomycetes bacterium]|nr:NAD-dependent protein deacetylase [Planctomycetota bacterium]
MTNDSLLDLAAEAIASADALLIGAGAGMGVDSGLPDFRGDKGFWNAYPPYARLGLNFIDMANPRWFRQDPEMGWGFYGHRLNLYRQTPPHAGFGILRRWAARMPRGSFVYTSNVDSHFQRAGFPEDRVVEVHGAIEWLQCTRRACGRGLWSVDPVGPPVTVDETTMRAIPPLPACPACSALARPNVLMFGDAEWDEGRSWQQEVRFNQWRDGLAGARLVVVECGAGTAIPSVRRLCENVADAGGTPGHRRAPRKEVIADR